MTYGFAGVEPVAKVKVNASKIRELREARAWSQEGLAEVAKIGSRTIQRVEQSGEASIATLQAIATALDTEPDALKAAEAGGRAETKKSKDEPIPVLLTRISNGSVLFHVLGGADALYFEYDEPQTQGEVDLLGSMAQDTQDYLDIWREMEPMQRVQAAFDYNTRIEELKEAGFVLFGARKVVRLRMRDKEPFDWTFAVMHILRPENPRIAKSPDGEIELVATAIPRKFNPW